MTRTLIDPRLVSSVVNTADWFPQRCTIQAGTRSRDAFGEWTDVWNDQPNLVGIPCRRAPQSNAGAERQTQEATTTGYQWRAALAGYFPQITTKMRAVIDGVVHDIDNVDWDANHTLTYLDLTRAV